MTNKYYKKLLKKNDKIIELLEEQNKLLKNMNKKEDKEKVEDELPNGLEDELIPDDISQLSMSDDEESDIESDEETDNEDGEIRSIEIKKEFMNESVDESSGDEESDEEEEDKDIKKIVIAKVEGGSKKEKKEKPKKKKKLSKYMQFRKEQYASIKKENPKMTFKEVNKEITKRWNAQKK